MSTTSSCSRCPEGNRATRRAHDKAYGVAIGLVAAIVLGSTVAGPASAAGDDQPGVTSPATPGGDQPGVTTPAPSTPPSQPDPGAQALPPPPALAAPRPAPDYTDNSPNYAPSYFQGPSTNTPAYNRPSQPLHLPTPTPEVRPIEIPKDQKIVRIGKFVAAQPNWLTNAQRRTINNYSAFLEAKIAQSLISVGFSPREADRQAASATIGAVLGGTAGAIAVGLPVAVVASLGLGLAGAGVGAAIGAFVPPQPINVGTGALIGAGSGVALGLGVGAAAALAGAIGGGVLGGIAGYLLGGGDPDAHPGNPLAPAPRHARPAPVAPLPNPGADQYRLTVGEKAHLPGNGTVDYVVARSGAVSIDATVAGHSLHAGWSAAQAQRPLKALGAAQSQVRHTIDDVTRQVTAAANALPGVHAGFPQTVTPRHAAAGRHR